MSNVFFVREGSIITPPVSCGLLPGIAREVLMERYEIREEILRPEDAAACEEMFLTNSLMGVVPVRRLGSHTFAGTETGMRLASEFRELNSGVFRASSGGSAEAPSVDAR
ncbi:MAG: aminotransferase class IV [Clostridiales bacterium]|nr:aminotransferase class IV [Clostridiales bacterium]